MAIFDEPSRKPLPQPTFQDVGHAAGKGLMQMVPLVGGVGSELFALLSSPLAQRRDDWFSDLERRLLELEGRVAGFRFEDLGRNEQFVSATLQATQAALKIHEKGKLDALRSAVLNVALGKEPDTTRQWLFLSLVDRFSEAHLILLRFFNDPAGYYQRSGRPVPLIQTFPKLLAYDLVRDAMPHLAKQVKSPEADRTAAPFQFIELILEELVSTNLLALDRRQETLAVPKFDPGRTPSPVKQLTTHLGDDLLAFITEPAEGK
jgi:hypothetical protein